MGQSSPPELALSPTPSGSAEGQERKTESKLAELPRDVHEGDDAFQAIVSEGLYAFFDQAQAALDTFRTDVAAAPPVEGTGTRPRETNEEEDVDAEDDADEE